MRILFDTNVLLDATVSDRPHHRDALFLLNEVEQEHLSGVLAPLSLGTLWYLGHDVYDTDPRPLIRDLSKLMDLSPMGRPVLSRALDHDENTDFEDVYLAESGLAAGATGVVTRNEEDFASTDLTAFHPTELVQMLS